MHTAATFRLPERRTGILALTLLVHVALLLAWQTARRPARAHDPARRAIQWIWLPAPKAATPPGKQREAPRRGAPAALPRPIPPARTPAPPVPAPARNQAAPAAAEAAPAPMASTAATDPAPLSASAYSATPAASLLERARQAAGAADRAVRKDNRAYIVAPPDSPQLRMRRNMEAANAMAPNAWYQAPKTAELVNQTGDGARRDRVTSGSGTYCVTERAPTTSIDMIEKHGKLRITNCPQHESTANAQEWRTAQDP